jgi:hypothetical protein
MLPRVLWLRIYWKESGAPRVLWLRISSPYGEGSRLPRILRSHVDCGPQA